MNVFWDRDDLLDLLDGSSEYSPDDPKTSTPIRLSPTHVAMTSYPSSALTTRSSSVSPSRHGYHSPVRHSGSSPVIQKNAASSPGSPGNRMYHNSPPRQNYMSELETATIHRQRRELQLLIAELQDRDRELNEMVHAHQKQMIAWEEDRQRILALEQRNSRLDAEIRGKAEQVKHLTGRLKLIETQEQSKTCALETTQKQLEKMSEKASSSTMQLQDLEGRNMSLNSTIREVSSQLGQLEAREQELITMLKLKDKDLLEASNHISEITGKLKRLDTMYREYRQSDLNNKKDIEDWKQRHGDLKAENDRLRGELGVSSTNSTEQQIQMNKARDEIQSLKRELHLAAERDKRKEQLLELQRSRQERVDAELNNLRQLYERQQKDATLLQLNLDSKNDLLSLQESRISHAPDDLNNSFSPTRRCQSISPSHFASSSSLLSRSPVSPSKSLNLSHSGKVNYSNLSTSLDGDPAIDASSGETDELLNITANDLADNSPTSKLHRLLSESREMVKNLEKTTLPPYFTKASNKTA